MDRRPRGRERREVGAILQSLTPLAVAMVAAGCAPPRAGMAELERRAGQPAPAPFLVFDGVTVVDVEQGKLLPKQRVVIAGNRIMAVGNQRAVPLPAGAQVVKTPGKYLIPGLWDLHAHAAAAGPSYSFGTATTIVSKYFYPLLLANGVTGIRDPHSNIPLDTLLGWRREVLAGTRMGPPRQLHGAWAIDGLGTCTRTSTSGHVCVAGSADARHLVDSLQAAGVDMLKTYGLSPKELYFVVAAEARRVGLPFGGHVTPPLTAAEASDSGARIIDHPDASNNGGLETLCAGTMGGSVAQCRPLAERLRRNNTWWAPTIVVVLQVFQIMPPPPERRRMFGPRTHSLFTHFEGRMRAFWTGSQLEGNWLQDSVVAGAPQTAGARANAAADTLGFMSIAQRVGLPIVASTDAGGDSGPQFWTLPPGFGLHAELAIYVTEGLTPLAALQSATLNPAKMLHATDSLGTVAPGKLADLVLLDADPLADITNTTTIRAVVANGRYFDRAALDRLRAEARATGRELKSAGVIP